MEREICPQILCLKVLKRGTMVLGCWALTIPDDTGGYHGTGIFGLQARVATSPAVMSIFTTWREKQLTIGENALKEPG
jgi:hypothetical protein